MVKVSTTNVKGGGDGAKQNKYGAEFCRHWGWERLDQFMWLVATGGRGQRSSASWWNRSVTKTVPTSPARRDALDSLCKLGFSPNSPVSHEGALAKENAFDWCVAGWLIDGLIGRLVDCLIDYLSPRAGSTGGCGSSSRRRGAFRPRI